MKSKRKDILDTIKNLHKVHTKTQLKKMTKSGLIRLVIKLEKFIVSSAYERYKSKLPRLKTRQKALPKLDMLKVRKVLPKHKAKRKFSAKQLAAQRLFAKRAKAGTLRRRR
tara:strand:+ start:2740 stop:3072 length:333 start_codon:yes stop_codon:yes gene_type:complete